MKLRITWLVMSLVITIGFSIVFSACSESDNSSPSITENPKIGTDKTQLSSLRKQIPFSITNANPDLLIGDSYAARATSTSVELYWMAAVKNISTNTYCFIKLNTGEYRSTTGAVLGSEPIIYVNGQVRDVGTNIYSNTCLEAGKMGHFVGITQNVSFDQIGSIVFDSLTYSNSSSSPPAFTMSALGYSVASITDAAQQIDLTIHNYGPSSGVAAYSSLGLLMNSDNTPLIWAYFSRPSTWDGTLNPGENGVLQDYGLIYEGASNSLLLYLDYDEIPAPQAMSLQTFNQTSLTPSDFGTLEAFYQYLLSRRTEQENLKEFFQ